MNRQYFEDYCDSHNLVAMPKEKFVAEHKKLLGVLDRADPKELRAEAKEQAKELDAELKGKGVKQSKPAPAPAAARNTAAERRRVLERAYYDLVKRHVADKAALRQHIRGMTTAQLRRNLPVMYSFPPYR